MGKFYLRVEGVNLGNFVYDTEDISTVRGGSLLLLDAVGYLKGKVFTLALPGGKASEVELVPVTTGASSGTFEVDLKDVEKTDLDKAAEMLRGQVEECLKGTIPDEKGNTYDLKHATFVVDVQPASDNFLRDFESLMAKNRWRQMRQPSLAIPAAAPNAREHCDIDKVRPATSSIPDPDGGDKPVGASARTRHDYGREQKYAFYQKQTGARPPDIPGEFVRDLDALTADPSRGNLHHKLAILYLDGNHFGKLRRDTCQMPQDLKDYDHYIQGRRATLLKDFLTAAVMNDKKGWLTQNGQCRMEILMWGGDEMLWVVPAWQGWKTLAFLFDHTADWQFRETRMFHAAGLVFCHHNAAINRIKSLARDLAETAKAKSREKSLVAYQVLESFDHVGRGLEDFRKQRCPKTCTPEQFILKGTEMTHMESLFQAIKADEKLARRKLHDIVARLMKTPEASPSVIAEVLEQVASPTREDLDKLTACCSGSDKMRWVHLLELWDYVAP